MPPTSLENIIEHSLTRKFSYSIRKVVRKIENMMISSSSELFCLLPSHIVAGGPFFELRSEWHDIIADGVDDDGKTSTIGKFVRVLIMESEQIETTTAIA